MTRINNKNLIEDIKKSLKQKVTVFSLKKYPEVVIEIDWEADKSNEKLKNKQQSHFPFNM